MANKKFDIITFKGKYVEESFQIDRDLIPSSRERKRFLDDCFAEWDYWNTMAKKKDKEKYEEVKE